MEAEHKTATIGISDWGNDGYSNKIKKKNNENNLPDVNNNFNLDTKNVLFLHSRNGLEEADFSRGKKIAKQHPLLKLKETEKLPSYDTKFKIPSKFYAGLNSATSFMDSDSKKKLVGCINRRHANGNQPVYNVSSYRTSTKPMFRNEFIKYDTHDYPVRKFILGHYLRRTKKKKKQRARSNYFFCSEGVNNGILKLFQYISKFLRNSCVVVHLFNIFSSSNKRKQEKVVGVQTVYETFDFSDRELRSFMTGNVYQTDYRKIAKQVVSKDPFLLDAAVFPLVQNSRLRTESTYSSSTIKPAAVIIKTESLESGKQGIELQKPPVPITQKKISLLKSAVPISRKTDLQKYSIKIHRRGFTGDTEISGQSAHYVTNVTSTLSDRNHDNYCFISDNSLVSHTENNSKEENVNNNIIESIDLSRSDSTKKIVEFFDISCDDESHNTPGCLSNRSSYSIFPTYFRQTSDIPHSSTINSDIGRCVEYFDISSRNNSVLNPSFSFQNDCSAFPLNSINENETQNNGKSTVDSSAHLSLHSLLNSGKTPEEIENNDSDNNKEIIAVNKNKQHEVIVDESWVEYVKLMGNPNAVA